MDERKLKAVRRFLETQQILKDAQAAHDASQSALDVNFRYSPGCFRAVVDGLLIEVNTRGRSDSASLQTYPIAGVFNVEGSGLDGRSPTTGSQAEEV